MKIEGALTERRKLYREIRDRLVRIVTDPESDNNDFFTASTMIFDMDKECYNSIVDEWE